MSGNDIACMIDDEARSKNGDDDEDETRDG